MTFLKRFSALSLRRRAQPCVSVRLVDLTSGRALPIGGLAPSLRTDDPAGTMALLMRNRDPFRWRAEIITP